MAGTGDKLLTAAEIKEVTDTKVNISDVVNALNSTSINKPLSAAQGKVLNDAKVNKTDTIAIEYGGTNATSASNARINLGVYSKSEVDTAIAQSTADKAYFAIIANGTDLNTILTTGLYQSPGALSNVQTLINCPVTVPFIMIVRGEGGTSGCIQMIASEGVIYTRRGITSGLGSWYKFIGTVVS